MLVGGIARNFGEHGSSYRLGQGRDFVIEGDEYDSAFFDKTAKFLKYLPDIAVVNNIEFDHADIYADLDAVTPGVPPAGEPGAAARPAAARRRQPAARWRLPTRAVVARRDVRHRRAAPTGRRTIIESAGGVDALSACAGTASPFGEFEVPLLGAHNVRNALAAIAVGDRGRRRRASAFARACGSSRASSGGSRSSAAADGVTVYDDFAHHPTAVAETLAGLRAANPTARIWAVFEPRSASSCRRVFQDDFARAFAGADEVLIAPVFRSTLPEAERLSVPQLVARPAARGPVGARRRHRSTTSSRRSSASIGPATWWSSCRTAASAASIRSCCRRCRP